MISIFDEARNKLMEKATKPQSIIAHKIIDTLAANENELTIDICREIIEGKVTLKDCYRQIESNAKSQAIGGVAMIEDTQVYEWALKFFGYHGPLDEVVPKKESGLDFESLFGGL